MKTLLRGTALLGAAAVFFYATDHTMTSRFDAYLVGYVGLVSLAAASYTAYRTYKWTYFGVGLFFAALAIGMEGIHNSAYGLGWIDPQAVFHFGPWRWDLAGWRMKVGPFEFDVLVYLRAMKSLVRALLAVGYSYLLVGLIRNSDTGINESEGGPDESAV